MKKHFIILSFLILTFTFVGCGSNNNDSAIDEPIGNLKTLADAEIQFGLDLPDDFEVQVGLDFGVNERVSFLTEMTLDELEEYFIEEVEAKGYSDMPNRVLWSPLSSGDTESRTADYLKDNQSLNIIIDNNNTLTDEDKQLVTLFQPSY